MPAHLELRGLLGSRLALAARTTHGLGPFFNRLLGLDCPFTAEIRRDFYANARVDSETSRAVLDTEAAPTRGLE